MAGLVRDLPPTRITLDRTNKTTAPKLKQFSELLCLPLGLRAPSSRRSAFFKAILLPLIEQVLRHSRQAQQPSANHLRAALGNARAVLASVYRRLAKQGLARTVFALPKFTIFGQPSLCVHREHDSQNSALKRAKDCHTACSSTTTVNQTVLGRQLSSQPSSLAQHKQACTAKAAISQTRQGPAHLSPAPCTLCSSMRRRRRHRRRSRSARHMSRSCTRRKYALASLGVHRSHI